MGQDVIMTCIWTTGVKCNAPVVVGPYCGPHAIAIIDARTKIDEQNQARNESQRLVPRDMPAIGGMAPVAQERSYVSVQLPHISADADFAATMEACDQILARKGHDYTQGGDRLKNFYSTAADLGVPARAVWAVYFGKHIDAIKTWVKDGAVKSEPIEGRIHDAINYLLLLAKMLRREKREIQEEAGKVIAESVRK